MLYLTTGVPGAGKTLWTIVTVEARRKAENREVYYHGIKGLTLPWHELEDPKKWYECPPGSIIVIVEAQNTFPARGTGQPVPRHVAETATHRHNGQDIYLDTQHPLKLDSSLRKDIEQHRHLMRKFGSKWVTVHQFVGVRDNCDKSRKDSIPSQWRHPKEAFDWYKSAEVHTHKFSVPWKLWLVVLLPVVVGYAGYRVFSRADGVPSKPPQSPQGGRPQVYSSMPMGSSGTFARPRAFDAASYRPRIDGLPYTAPRYDGLTDPVRVPVIVGCWLSPSQGWCITQQGTRLTPPRAFIQSFIANGQFRDFEAGPPIGSAGGMGVAPGSSDRQGLMPATNVSDAR